MSEKRKPITVFRMASNYQKMEVTDACRMTKSIIGVTTVRPNKGKSRRERYDILAAELFRVWGIPAPSYRATKAERGAL